jgi:hypothetical protein
VLKLVIDLPSACGELLKCAEKVDKNTEENRRSALNHFDALIDAEKNDARWQLVKQAACCRTVSKNGKSSRPYWLVRALAIGP